MKTRDGGPVTRDVDFLVEANLVPRAMADRVFRRQAAFRPRSAGAAAAEAAAAAALASMDLGRGDGQAARSWAGADAKPPPTDDEPITIYSYARPAGQASSLTGSGGGRQAPLTAAFYGTGGPKLRPMDRNDQFTKLMGDVNKAADDAAPY